jgi:uracil-DNA glycosylase
MTNEIWNEIVFTMAVLFTRQGNHFRGNEFYDEKFGLEVSLPYLQRQIEIIQPKIIVPFGGAAWSSVRKIFKLEDYPSKITDIVAILNRKPIVIGDTTIIPNFHPASHTDPKIGYEIWKTIWKYL